MGNMRDRRNTVPYTYPAGFVSREATQGGPEPPKSGLWELAVLVLVLAGTAVALYLLGGTPHLPQPWPSWDTVVFTLRGSYLPPELVVYAVSTLGWLLWSWTVSSLVLETLVVTAEAVGSGAAWAGTLRQVSRWVAIPLVRRVVDGTLGAVLLAQVVSRPPLEGGASGLTSPAVAFAAPWERPGTPHLVRPGAQDDGEEADQDEGQVIEYTIQPGDNLWDISKRFYGTGEEWPRLMAANVGRRMADGRIFPREGVIQPGWVLRVLLPSQVVETAGTQTFYTVESGDTLYGIAARLLGDETRWPEIFALNRGVAHLEDGRTLTKPELIWPGLRLHLPLVVQAGRAEATQPTASSASLGAALASAPPATPTPVATPEPVSAVETAAPEETRSAPVAAHDAGAPPVPRHDNGSLPLAAAAAATAVVLGGAARLARWRLRQHPDGPPLLDDREEDMPLQRGFVIAEPSRALTHRLHGQEAELALLAAEHLRVFLAKRGIRHIGLLTVGQGKRRLSLTLRAPLAERAGLLEAMNAFRKRLGLRGDVRLTDDQDVFVEASWLKRAAFLTPPDGPPPNPPWLIPLGMLGDQQTLYVNWREVSNLLVAGSAGGDVQTLTTSLLAVLGARCQPPYLRLWVIADPQRLPPPLLKLPHLRGVIDPGEEVRVQVLLEEVRQTLLGRMVDEEELGIYRDPMLMGPPVPELLVVVGELGAVAAHQATLEFIGRNGPAYGVRLLAATTTPAALDDEVLECFGTRVMLGLEDEGASLRLLGTPDGVDLGGGQVLVRIEGREVVQAHGFAIAPEQLEHVVSVMQETYRRDLMHTRRVTPVPAADDQEERYPIALGQERPSDEMVPADASCQIGVSVPNEVSDLLDPEAGPDVTGETAANEEDATALGLLDHPERGGEAPRDDAPAAPLVEMQVSAEAVIVDGQPDAHTSGGPLPVSLPALVPPAEALAPNGSIADVHGGAPPMVQVQCFGGLAVTCGNQVLSPVGRDGVAQYQAWELLALVAARPERGVSKEHVISILWPEDDPHKADRRLPNVIARLRGVLRFQVPGLTSDIMQVDRAGMCWLDQAQITSDVQRFLALCQEAARLPAAQARARWEQALALYQGDLLHGQTYPWLQDREESGPTLVERYRSEYLRVMRELAASYLADGDAVRAAPLYHRTLERNATDEVVVRGLYRCYQQLGDRTGVLREHRQLKQALAALFRGDDETEEDADWEPEPQPETMALYEEVMADLEARVRRVS